MISTLWSHQILILGSSDMLFSEVFCEIMNDNFVDFGMRELQVQKNCSVVCFRCHIVVARPCSIFLVGSNRSWYDKRIMNQDYWSSARDTSKRLATRQRNESKSAARQWDDIVSAQFIAELKAEGGDQNEWEEVRALKLFLHMYIFVLSSLLEFWCKVRWGQEKWRSNDDTSH